MGFYMKMLVPISFIYFSRTNGSLFAKNSICNDDDDELSHIIFYYVDYHIAVNRHNSQYQLYLQNERIPQNFLHA